MSEDRPEDHPGPVRGNTAKTVCVGSAGIQERNGRPAFPFFLWGEYMNVEVREKNGKWGVWTDEIRYNSYDTETEAQDKATHIRRAVALMDKLQETVEKETAEWDEADKAEFSNWYGTGTAKALNL